MLSALTIWHSFDQALLSRRREIVERLIPFLTLNTVSQEPERVVVPYANANNRQHSPNEHLRLDHLFQGVRTTAQLLRDLGT
jgi:hypothetical protein